MEGQLSQNRVTLHSVCSSRVHSDTQGKYSMYRTLTGRMTYDFWVWVCWVSVLVSASVSVDHESCLCLFVPVCGVSVLVVRVDKYAQMHMFMFMNMYMFMFICLCVSMCIRICIWIKARGRCAGTRRRCECTHEGFSACHNTHTTPHPHTAPPHTPHAIMCCVCVCLSASVCISICLMHLVCCCMLLFVVVCLVLCVEDEGGRVVCCVSVFVCNGVVCLWKPCVCARVSRVCAMG